MGNESFGTTSNGIDRLSFALKKSANKESEIPVTKVETFPKDVLVQVGEEIDSLIVSITMPLHLKLDSRNIEHAPLLKLFNSIKLDLARYATTEGWANAAINDVNSSVEDIESKVAKAVAEAKRIQDKILSLKQQAEVVGIRLNNEEAGTDQETTVELSVYEKIRNQLNSAKTELQDLGAEFNDKPEYALIASLQERLNSLLEQAKEDNYIKQNYSNFSPQKEAVLEGILYLKALKNSKEVQSEQEKFLVDVAALEEQYKAATPDMESNIGGFTVALTQMKTEWRSKFAPVSPLDVNDAFAASTFEVARAKIEEQARLLADAKELLADWKKAAPPLTVPETEVNPVLKNEATPEIEVPADNADAVASTTKKVEDGPIFKKLDDKRSLYYETGVEEFNYVYEEYRDSLLRYLHWGSEERLKAKETAKANYHDALSHFEIRTREAGQQITDISKLETKAEKKENGGRFALVGRLSKLLVVGTALVAPNEIGDGTPQFVGSNGQKVASTAETVQSKAPAFELVGRDNKALEVLVGADGMPVGVVDSGLTASELQAVNEAEKMAVENMASHAAKAEIPSAIKVVGASNEMLKQAVPASSEVSPFDKAPVMLDIAAADNLSDINIPASEATISEKEAPSLPTVANPDSRPERGAQFVFSPKNGVWVETRFSEITESLKDKYANVPEPVFDFEYNTVYSSIEKSPEQIGLAGRDIHRLWPDDVYTLDKPYQTLEERLSNISKALSSGEAVVLQDNESAEKIFLDRYSSIMDGMTLDQKKDYQRELIESIKTSPDLLKKLNVTSGNLDLIRKDQPFYVNAADELAKNIASKYIGGIDFTTVPQGPVGAPDVIIDEMNSAPVTEWQTRESDSDIPSLTNEEIIEEATQAINEAEINEAVKDIGPVTSEVWSQVKSNYEGGLAAFNQAMRGWAASEQKIAMPIETGLWSVFSGGTDAKDSFDRLSKLTCEDLISIGLRTSQDAAERARELTDEYHIMPTMFEHWRKELVAAKESGILGKIADDTTVGEFIERLFIARRDNPR